ncbi:MAG: B12-binding domain-containing radical SAM protein [Deltaproteobacteria bacterium]|nr:B12-binding domain-containing radical SAM protein [Deltaproteobacteria bacterium]
MRLKNVLLIHPMHEKLGDSRERISMQFPWGIGYLTKYYQTAGYNVRVLDGQCMQLTKDEILPWIDKHDFDIAGISAFSSQFNSVKLIAEHIKKTHRTPVIVGGALSTYQPQLTLKNTDVDVCVIGDGEISGIEVLDHFDELDRVKGIAFRKRGEVFFTQPQDKFVSLDDLPMPDFSLFEMDKYLSEGRPFAGGLAAKDRSIRFITSRGCPYSCHFCSKSARTYRAMSPSKVHNMAAFFKNEFKIGEISFGDELFLASKSRFRELAPQLKSLGLKWGSQARVNIVDKEFLDLIKWSGCEGLGYGIETGSQKILDNMNKGITVEQIVNAMAYTKKLKIPMKVQLIFGYPGEDEATVQETIELFRRVDHPGRRFVVITPIPGSQLYADCIRQGRIKDEIAHLTAIEKSFGWGKVHVNFTKWPDDEIYPRKHAAEAAIENNYQNRNLFRRVKYFTKRAKRRIERTIGKSRKKRVGS